MLILLIFFTGMNQTHARSDSTLVFAIDSIGSGITLDRYWKYHPGDDTAWARPAFDDARWDTLSTRLNLSELEPDVFEGTGWFRIHLQIDSSLLDKTFALLMDQHGASEIYLNGEKIQEFGTFSLDPEEEDVTNPNMLPGTKVWNANGRS